MQRSGVVVLALASLSLGGCSRRNAEASTGSSAASVASAVGPAPSAPASSAVTPSASGQAAPPAPPLNVLFISIDSLRADMPWSGYPRPIAPRLTALHERAVDYPHAYSISSFTSKSLGGLVSARYPSELARTGVFFTRYLGSNVMACESLAEDGVPCVAGHAHGYLAKGNTGLDQGFRDWRLVPGITFDFNTDPYVTSDKLTKMAIDMLSDATLTLHPFFAWFHFMDPHDEYQTHDGPHWGTRARDRYDEEVLYTDGWVGKLLDFVETQPWATRTVIAISADHGEAFGEHYEYRHAHELYEELVHVPLFFIVPGRGARTIDVARSQIDFMPTVAELVGAPPLPHARGVSFAKELLGAPPAPARDVVCDLPRDDINDRRRSILHDGWKLISFGDNERFSLFDIGTDPGETSDLYWKRREKAVEMMQIYKAASREIPEVPPAGGIPSHDAGVSRDASH